MPRAGAGARTSACRTHPLPSMNNALGAKGVGESGCTASMPVAHQRGAGRAAAARRAAPRHAADAEQGVARDTVREKTMSSERDERDRIEWTGYGSQLNGYCHLIMHRMLREIDSTRASRAGRARRGRAAHHRRRQVRRRLEPARASSTGISCARTARTRRSSRSMPRRRSSIPGVKAVLTGEDAVRAGYVKPLHTLNFPGQERHEGARAGAAGARARQGALRRRGAWRWWSPTAPPRRRTPPSWSRSSIATCRR